MMHFTKTPALYAVICTMCAAHASNQTTQARNEYGARAQRMHLCATNAFLRNECICAHECISALLMHFCATRNAFVRNECVCAQQMNLCVTNAFVHYKCISALLMHLCATNAFVRDKYICAQWMHLCATNALVRNKCICAEKDRKWIRRKRST